MTAIRISDDRRTLEFDDARTGMPTQVYPSSETGQLSSGTRRVSKTWRFEHEGREYRVQLQYREAP